MEEEREEEEEEVEERSNIKESKRKKLEEEKQRRIGNGGKKIIQKEKERSEDINLWCIQLHYFDMFMELFKDLRIVDWVGDPNCKSVYYLLLCFPGY